MPIETVETQEETIEVQPMIALQPLPEPASEEVVLQTSEEIVTDHGLVYVDSIPIPAPEIEISTEDDTSPRKGRGKKRGRGRQVAEVVLDSESDISFVDGQPRKWEQKQVQIKTLDGEFSVTMWATGESFGAFSNKSSCSGVRAEKIVPAGLFWERNWTVKFGFGGNTAFKDVARSFVLRNGAFLLCLITSHHMEGSVAL